MMSSTKPLLTPPTWDAHVAQTPPIMISASNKFTTPQLVYVVQPSPGVQQPYYPNQPTTYPVSPNGQVYTQQPMPMYQPNSNQPVFYPTSTQPVPYPPTSTQPVPYPPTVTQPVTYQQPVYVQPQTTFNPSPNAPVVDSRRRMSCSCN